MAWTVIAPFRAKIILWRQHGQGCGRAGGASVRSVLGCHLLSHSAGLFRVDRIPYMAQAASDSREASSLRAI